jgi:MOSC domain-containing protein YiiM
MNETANNGIANNGSVDAIIRYTEKGVPGIPLTEALFREGHGLEGDFHADGSDRQISLLSRESRQWMEEATEPGLCFTRFKENITTRLVALEKLSAGKQLKAGNVVLEISGETKHCHEECSLFSAGHSCGLSGQSLFAKVVRGGILRIGDTIKIQEGP